MIENSFVKKMVANVKRGRKNASYDRHIMHPEREWFMLVLLGMVVFAGGVGMNIVTDQKFKNISVSYGSEQEEQVLYRAGLVEDALQDFTERTNEYESLKTSLVGRQSVPAPIVSDIGPETEALPTETEEVSTPSEPEPAETTAPEEIYDVSEIRFE